MPLHPWCKIPAEGKITHLAWDPKVQTRTSGEACQPLVLLASITDKGALTLWDVSTSQAYASFSALARGGQSATRIGWSPCGNLIAAAGNRFSVRLLNVASKNLIAHLEGHSAEVKTCSWSPRGDWFVSASANNELIIWSSKKLREIKRLPGSDGHKKQLSDVKWCPADSNIIASVDQSCNLILWDVKLGTKKKRLDCFSAGFGSALHAVAWSQCGSKVAAAGYAFKRHSLQVWTRTGEPTGQNMDHCGNNWVWDISWGPANSGLVACATYTGKVFVWDEPRGELKEIIETGNGCCNAVAWGGRDGNVLATAGEQGEIHLFGQSEGSHKESNYDNILPSNRPSTPAQSIHLFKEISHTQTNNRLCGIDWHGDKMVTLDKEGNAELWNTSNGVIFHHLCPGFGSRDYSVRIAFSPNGQQIVCPGLHSSVCLIDVVETCLTVGKTLKGHSQDVNACCWSPNGDQVASLSADQSVAVWRVSSGQQLTIFRGHHSTVHDLGWCPTDNHTIVTVSEDNTLRLWNTISGSCTKIIQGAIRESYSGHSLHSVSWSPDGKLIVSGGYLYEQHPLQLWHKDGTVVQSNMRNPGSSALRGVSWCPDENESLVACCSRDLILWNVSTHNRVQIIKTPMRIRRLVWRNDGKCLAGIGDNHICLWSRDGTVSPAVPNSSQTEQLFKTIDTLRQQLKSTDTERARLRKEVEALRSTIENEVVITRAREEALAQAQSDLSEAKGRADHLETLLSQQKASQSTGTGPTNVTVSSIRAISAQDFDAALSQAQVIGRGSSGTVYQAQIPGFSRRMAIKVIEIANSEQDTSFHQQAIMEIVIGSIRAPGLQCLKAVCLPRLALIYPLASPPKHLPPEALSLDFIASHPELHSRFGLQNWLTVIQDACTGLHALHATGMVHRDVKSANILLDSNGGLLCDAGLVRTVSSTMHSSDASTTCHSSTGAVGTPGWMDPGIGTNDFKCQFDIYSVGVLLLELLSGLPAVYQKHSKGPWLMLQQLLFDRRLTAEKVAAMRPSSSELKIPGQIRLSLFDLAMECMEPDFESRPRPTSSAIAQALNDIARSRPDQPRERLCVVCWDACINTRLRPCMHCCMCVDCTTSVKESGDGCPVCRQDIEGFETGWFPRSFMPNR